MNRYEAESIDEDLLLEDMAALDKWDRFLRRMFPEAKGNIYQRSMFALEHYITQPGRMQARKGGWKPKA